MTVLLFERAEMSLILTSPPASEPVTLAEAKAHLKIDVDDDDDLITRLIASARRAVEQYTGRALVMQSWRFTIDQWPASRTLALPKPPLLAVTAVTTYDRAGTGTVLSPSSYIVDADEQPARITLKETTVLPSPLREAGGIAVAFDAGYGSPSDVPDALKTAILSLVAHLYASRGDGDVPPPFQAIAMMAPYRVVPPGSWS